MNPTRPVMASILLFCGVMHLSKRTQLGALTVLALAACGIEPDVTTLGSNRDAGTGPDDSCTAATRPRTDDCTACACEDGDWVCWATPCAAPDCDPGEERPAGDGCNTCTCGDDGRWACTTMGCCVAEAPTPDVDDRCTACGCIEGRWECVATPCPPLECEPGDQRLADDGCNTCSCTEDGWWACTEIACGCNPGDQRIADDGCNSCSCTEDGRWICTTMACPIACDRDADCMKTGCSGQYCSTEPIASTCEFLPEYACYADAECGCVDGQCRFGPEDALSECLDDFE